MSTINPLSNYTYNTLVLQRNLGNNQNLLNRTIERLTTGLRINRAADDPLGITLARRTQTQLVSNRQAADNTQQSIILADTANNSVQGVISNLQRMRELILQSLNDTSSATDRARIQTEIHKLVENTDYLSRQSIFNTRQLLDGSLTDFVLPSDAIGEISYNANLKDSGSTAFQYLTADPVIDANTSAFDTVQFKIFDNGSGGYGLQVSTANGGVALTYDDISTAPTTLSLTAGGATASFSTAAIAAGATSISGPLTSAELDDSIGNLVASGRLNAVAYGALDLTLGGTANSGVFNLSSSSTLNQVLSALNGVSGVSATYDTSTGLFGVGYTGSKQVTSTNITNYDTAGTASGVGGPYSSFALLPSATDGPAYRDITSFLPTAGSFGLSSPPTYFPTYPGALDTALDFTGTSANILSFFDWPGSYANEFTVTDYTTEFYGDAVATGNPNEYVNRTRAVITSITGEQTTGEGQSTGLTTADLTRSLGELSTPYVTLSSGATSLPDFTTGGPFSIDFGSNGVFNYNFDPNTDTIQSVIDAINAYGVGINTADSTANVTANYDPVTGKLSLHNDPPDGGAISMGIAENTEIENSQLKLAFGSKSTDIVTVNNPSDLTIDELVTAINDQLNKAMGTTGVVIAEFSYNSLDDRLSFDLSKYTTSTAYGNKVVFDLSGSTGPDGEPNGYDIADFFNLIPEGTTAADFNTAGGVVNASGNFVTSLNDVDNSLDIDPLDPREITQNIYLTYTLAQLSAPISATADNSITFSGNTTTTALQDFFNIASAPNTGTLATQHTHSTTDIDNGALYSGLDVVDPTAQTFTELLTAPSPTLQGLSGLIGQTLKIDGTDVITIASTTTLNAIINAIDALPANNNKTYDAFFNNTTGRLYIRTTDIESTTAPGASAAASPNQATPTVNGNQITLDSAAYTAASSGTPPADYSPYTTTQPPAPYVFTDPSTPGDISSIVFGGATNLASVLGLANAANASVSGPTTTLTEYQATATLLSGTTYALTADKRVTFGATSSSTGSAAVGNTVTSGGGGSGYVLDASTLPSDGIVAQVDIFPAIVGRFENKGLVFQIGGEEGNSLHFNINELTAESLHLEGLSVYKSGDSDTLARLRGNNALRIVDGAIENSLDVLNQVGIYQRLLESNLEYLGNKQVTMSQYLSDLQDADTVEESTNYTKAQVTAQVGAALFAQNSANTSSIYSLLFGNNGSSGLGF